MDEVDEYKLAPGDLDPAKLTGERDPVTEDLTLVQVRHLIDNLNASRPPKRAWWKLGLWG